MYDLIVYALVVYDRGLIVYDSDLIVSDLIVMCRSQNRILQRHISPDRTHRSACPPLNESNEKLFPTAREREKKKKKSQFLIRPV